MKIVYILNKNNSNIIKFAIAAFLSVTIGTGILFFPQASSNGAKNGIIFCFQVLIPSLFPFMVLSSFVVKSGISSSIGNFINPLTKLLFNLPGCAGATILISMIGGYPTGAKGISSLKQNNFISDKQAERMLLFCVGAGPAFVISVVGTGILKNTNIGIILFFSQIIASIIIGIFTRIFMNSNQLINQKVTYKSNINISTAIVESTYESAFAMINMCAFVVIFYSLISIMSTSGLFNLIELFLSQIGISRAISNSIIQVILEVTNGCNTAGFWGTPPEFISFALGWAGLCIHFQIFSSTGNIKFSKIKFTFFRLIHGLLSAEITHIILKAFPNLYSKTVFFSNTEKISPSLSTNILGSISLIILAVVFILSVNQQSRKSSLG